MIFNKEREFSTTYKKQLEATAPTQRGMFEEDGQIQTSMARSPLEAAIMHPLPKTTLESTPIAQSPIMSAPAAQSTPLTRRPTVVSNKERAAAFETLALEHDKLMQAVNVLTAYREELQGDLSPMEVNRIFLNCTELDQACADADKVLQDLAQRNQAAKGHVGAALRQVHVLLSEPLAAFCQRTEAALKALQSAISVDQSLSRALSLIANAHGRTIEDAMHVPRDVTGAMAHSMGRLLEATARAHPDYNVLAETLNKFMTLQSTVKHQQASTSFKTRAPSSLLDNMIAYSDDSLQRTASAPVLGMLARQASGFMSSAEGSMSSLPTLNGSGRASPLLASIDEDSPGSAYSTLLRGPSKRMSMVPDVPLDDDELPRAEYRPSMAHIIMEEDDDVDGGDEDSDDDQQGEQGAMLALQLSQAATEATTDYTSLPELATVREANDDDSTNGDAVWLHRGISKDEAEEKLRVGTQDGHFLVRERPGAEGEYVLSLIYKGKPTHHLMKTDDNGHVSINRKVVGLPAPTTLGAAIKLVTAEAVPPGWPLRLISFPPRDGASEEDVQKEKVLLGLV